MAELKSGDDVYSEYHRQHGVLVKKRRDGWLVRFEDGRQEICYSEELELLEDDPPDP